jgi:type I restriction enzyme M protein
MSTDLTEKKIALLDLLAKNLSLGNAKARELLGLNEAAYESLKAEMLGEGKIVLGRGRGGSIKLAEVYEPNAMRPHPRPLSEGEGGMHLTSGPVLDSARTDTEGEGGMHLTPGPVLDSARTDTEGKRGMPKRGRGRPPKANGSATFKPKTTTTQGSWSGTWIAPSERDTERDSLEKKLWGAADEMRANSGLKSSEYSTPVLGLIFLRFAEVRFANARKELEQQEASSRRASRVDEPTAYHAKGIIFLERTARYDYLLEYPEGGKGKVSLAQAVNEAMRAIERDNPQLAGVLPKTYERFSDPAALKSLIKTISTIPASLEFDAFGRIYEYFLGEFARSEGQKGGEFFTPLPIVRLLVEVLEPFHGRILDPACGSGGMFVQSARFVSEHRKNPSSELSVFGMEKEEATTALCRMNLAMHGLEGDVKQAISYYDDPHRATGRFDFVLANPPFNVNKVDKERLEAMTGPGRRYPFGMPRTDNGNYLWIQLFHSALNATGRAGFVMANSASDARSSEQDIRRQLLEDHAVDVMVSVGPNMFYTVTLPCTLWFLDKGKKALTPGPVLDSSRAPRAAEYRFPNARTDRPGMRGARRRDTMLFLDARHIYRQVDRAHRDWTEAQIGFLSNIVRLYRGEAVDVTFGGPEALDKLTEVFSVPPEAEAQALAMAAEPAERYGRQPDNGQRTTDNLHYRDIPGLCKVATLDEIAAQGYSLNPGRYVGVVPGVDLSDEDFKEKLEALNEELVVLNAQARELEETIEGNVTDLLSM